MRRSTLAAFIPALIAILAAHNPVNAQADPVMEYCSGTGCSSVVTLLNPCGGGASNSSLQQDFTYTVTPDLGSCECNSQFFNALSSCLGCVSSQGKNFPAIDTQINWTNSCKAAGFNFTQNPIPYQPPTSGGSDRSGGGGLGGGAIAGIVIALLVVAGAGGFLFWRSRGGGRRSKNSIFERPYTAANASGSYEPTNNQAGFNTYNNYQHDDEYTSDLISNDHLLYNDKAVIEDDDEGVLEPPRARDRYRNDRDDFTQRRSMTPPRANMQSYRDEFTRPSFDREPRRNSGSERGSISGLRVAAGAGSGYNSQDESSEGGLQSGRLDLSDSPESARRRRAADSFCLPHH
ncbi:hypothetical protein BGZ90_007950 [Linnemannia elongata]|nr:hypothetical protein BGZ90_007950 [Linnemannia elongata]